MLILARLYRGRNCLSNGANQVSKARFVIFFIFEKWQMSRQLTQYHVRAGATTWCDRCWIMLAWQLVNMNSVGGSLAQLFIFKWNVWEIFKKHQFYFFDQKWSTEGRSPSGLPAEWMRLFGLSIAVSIDRIPENLCPYFPEPYVEGHIYILIKCRPKTAYIYKNV